MDDETLIRRIARSEPEALAELYDRYGRLVYSLALAITNDAGLSEEVSQDVFLQVWRKAGSYRPEAGRVLTWLSRIARNRAIDMLRRQNVRPEGSWISLDGLESLTAERAGLEPFVLDSSSREQVRQALAALPPEQRTALALAYFRGLSQQEIAALLHQPLGTSKTRVRLALHQLRAFLAEEHSEDRR